MNTSLEEIIRCHARPMKPVPTDQRPVLRKLSGIRAVLFDVYGTLLISASGDIDTGDFSVTGKAFVDALSAIGIRFHADGDMGVKFLVAEIQAANEQARMTGIEYPEVEIVAIWDQVMARIIEDGLTSQMAAEQSRLAAGVTNANLKRLALEYEMRVNPVWPMPHARECLDKLSRSGLSLGLISNAQFLTIEILQTLLQTEAGGFEFDEQLQFYSFQHRRAKPGLELYKLASKGLSQRGFREDEVLYIGNDMLKDVMPASSLGFRTALFAGDARSLRLRKEDERVLGITPDLVITDLSDVPNCIS